MVGTEFPGDEDDRLKRIQVADYSRVLGIIVRICIRRYLYSEEVLQVTSPLSNQIEELGRGDSITVPCRERMI